MSGRQEMYGYGSLLVLITPFMEILKVKIIFHDSKTICKISKLSILMTVRGGGRHTKCYFCCSSVRKNQNLVSKKSGNFIDNRVWEPCYLVIDIT